MATPRPNQTDTTLSGVVNFTGGSVSCVRTKKTGEVEEWRVSGEVEALRWVRVRERGPDDRYTGKERDDATLTRVMLTGYGANPGLAAQDFITRHHQIQLSVASFQTKKEEEKTLVEGLEPQLQPPPKD